MMKYDDNIQRDNNKRVMAIRTKISMMKSQSYKNGNWELVKENISPAPGEGGAHLYAIHAEDVIVGEWIFDENGTFVAERTE